MFDSSGLQIVGKVFAPPNGYECCGTDDVRAELAEVKMWDKLRFLFLKVGVGPRRVRRANVEPKLFSPPFSG